MHIGGLSDFDPVMHGGKIIDPEDRRFLLVAAIRMGAIGIVTILGAGIIGLAIRVFMFAAGG
jgi:hypothetical protein